MFKKLKSIFTGDALENIPKANEEQLSWLESKDITESKRIEFILKNLFEKGFIEKINIKTENTLLELIDEFIDIISIQDNSKYIINLGGLNIFLGLVFNSKSENIIKKSCMVLVDISSDNIFVQNYLINIGVLELLNKFSLTTIDKLKENYIKVIYSVCKGNNLNPKRLFLRLNGIDTLMNIFLKNNNNNLRVKFLNLLYDLLDNDNLFKYENDLKTEITEKSIIKFGFLDYFSTKKIEKYQKVFLSIIEFIINDIDLYTVYFKENYLKCCKKFFENSLLIKGNLNFLEIKNFKENLKILINKIDTNNEAYSTILNYSNEIIELLSI